MRSGSVSGNASRSRLRLRYIGRGLSIDLLYPSILRLYRPLHRYSTPAASCALHWAEVKAVSPSTASSSYNPADWQKRPALARTVAASLASQVAAARGENC